MLKRDELFVRRDCKPCGFAHYFDRESQVRLCVYSIVRYSNVLEAEKKAEMARRNERFVRDVMIAENIRPRAELERKRLLDALEEMTPNRRQLYEALQLPLSTV